MWSSVSLILLCQTTLANDENHAELTTEPHIAYVFINTRCVIFPRVPFCPDLLYIDIYALYDAILSVMQTISLKFFTSAAKFAANTSHFLPHDVSATVHTVDDVIASSWLILRGDPIKRDCYIFIVSEANVCQLVADDDSRLNTIPLSGTMNNIPALVGMAPMRRQTIT